MTMMIQGRLRRSHLVLAGAAAAALLSAPGVRAAPPSTYYGLAFEETFSGSSVNTSRWNYRTDVKALSATTGEVLGTRRHP